MQQVVLKCDVPFLPVRHLKTGDITCCYEAGNLRYIKWGSTEVVRLIYSAVRDEHWYTLPMIISNEAITEMPDGFSITYNAAYRSGKIDYIAAIEIVAHDNRISFSMKGEARSSFKKNRIGLCLLHPLQECMGQEMKIINPDGSLKSAQFPELVSPHQPFTHIREMEWTTKSGITTTVRFEGDIFETEDQRNWTDASFKTYSTPLEFPIPALVESGEIMHQVITLQFSRSAAEVLSEESVIEEAIRFPAVGFYREQGSAELTKEEVAFFSELPSDHYAVSIKLFDEGWKQELTLALREAEMLATRLELLCSFDDKFTLQLEDLIALLTGTHHLISSVLLVDCTRRVTTSDLSQYCYQELKAKFPLLSVGYGTDGNFAELNRNRPQHNDYDFLSFSLYPQAHANDNRTIIENLESHWHNIATMKSFAKGRQLHVLPVSFNKRDSIIMDERQHSEFAAYWQLMCLSGLAEADRVTFYSLTGRSGMLKDDKHPTPFYELLKKIKLFQPQSIIQRFRNGRLLADGLIIENISGERLSITMVF